jgi:hypothetical protein
MKNRFDEAQPNPFRRSLQDTGIVSALASRRFPANITFRDLTGSDPIKNYQSSFRRWITLGFEGTSGSFAVFPITNQVVINHYGAFVPSSVFGRGVDIEHSVERLEAGTVRITFHARKPAAKPIEPRFGSAQGQIQMSPDFDEPLEDFKEYM